MRVLLLEDQERFASVLKDCLDRTGHLTDVATTVDEFEQRVASESYDQLIIDLGLPDGDGLDVISRYRRSGGTAPIIIVTARKMVNDLVVGLDRGADDFLTKPFHVEVLLARIRAVQRRPTKIAAPTQCVGRMTLDRASGEITFHECNVLLAPAERRLLGLLMQRAGSVVPKTMIDCQIHGMDRPSTPNAVEQLVSRLRKSLARSKSGVDVKTVRGIGYVLEERPT